jgi:hypothetical protein
MNKAKKGYRAEKYLRDYFIGLGYKLMFKSIRYKFGCIDYANMFDMVLYHPTPPTKRLYISVKHHKDHQQLAEISEHKALYGKANEVYAQFIYHVAGWKGAGKNKTYSKGYFEIVEL